MNPVVPISGSIYFKNFKDFDAQLIRAFATDKDFGPSFGLCIATAMKIKEGNFNSWYSEWKASGDKLYEKAEESTQKGFNISALSDYLASSVCYRTADFFIRQDLNDERLIPLADMQRDSFRKGFGLFDFGLKVLNIPYENTTLDGYFFSSLKDGTAKPTLIFLGGYDSFVEEIFYLGGYQSLIRGYNCLAFDGPGQGQVLRRQKLYFRPDWEKVVTPVLDFAKTIPEIDKNKLILTGRSFSGYLAPRAACFDERPTALIADAALYNLGMALEKMLPPDMLKLLRSNNENDLDKIFENIFKDREKKFFFESRMSPHGAETPAQYLNMMKDYSMVGFSGNIKCPAFISAGEYDETSAQQSKLLYNIIGSTDKKYVLFNGEDGAGEHCESANQNIFYTTMFNWLDDRFMK